MSTSIDSFLKAAASYGGAGYVKLSNAKNQEAVQYGGRFFARKLGWYSKPTDEQNIAVRSNLLQSLAYSPENFSAKAIKAAAISLGMQGDETLQIANSPLSKREVVEIINKTRVYDRNEALGLNTLGREDVPADLQEEFDRIMSGGTQEEAVELVTLLNSSRFSSEDIQNLVSERMDQPDCAPFRDLKQKMAELCKGSYLTACANLGHVGTAEEMRAILDEKIQKKIDAKIVTGRMIETLSDPDKTENPFSADAKVFLLNRLAADEYFSSENYVKLLYSAQNGAVDLHRAIDKEDCSEQELADAFRTFYLSEQTALPEMQGTVLGANETMNMHQDILHLSALNIGKPMADFFTATTAAQEHFEKFFAGMELLASQGDSLPGVSLPTGGFPAFGTMVQLEQLFCADVDPLEYRSLEQVDDITRKMMMSLGANIQDVNPFGRGEVAGAYCSRMEDYVLDDLTTTANTYLEKDSPEKTLEEIVCEPCKDICRGQGLKMGEKVLNPVGTHTDMTEEALASDVAEFFTQGEVLDRKAMIAVCSFIHQGFQGVMLILGPKMGLGPLPDSLSTEGHLSDFSVSRNDDGSYSVFFECDIDHIECMGDYGTPGFVPLDGDNDMNRFHCEIGVRLAFDGNKPVFSIDQPPVYSYNLEARCSPEEIARLNQERIEQNAIPQNIEKELQDFIAGTTFEKLAPLTDDDKAEILKDAVHQMKQRSSEGILNRYKCKSCITSAIGSMLYQKAKEMNIRSCQEAVAGDFFASEVDRMLEEHPEYASLRDEMAASLKDKAQSFYVKEYLKAYTPEDIRQETRKNIEAVLERKQGCLELVDRLTTPDADGRAELSAGKAAWLRNEICNSFSLQDTGYVEMLLKNQEAFLPMYQLFAGDESDVSGMMAQMVENSAAAVRLAENFSNKSHVGSADQTTALRQLTELARLSFEENTGRDFAVSQHSRELIQHTVADLQHVVRQYGVKTPEERKNGPVHGENAAFESLQKNLASLEFFSKAIVPGLHDEIAETGDFSQVSPQTKMYLMDAGFCLNQYEGLAHGHRGLAGEQFVRALSREMSSYCLQVQNREKNSWDALEVIAKDLGRHGTGLAINGTQVSAVDGVTSKEDVVAAFENLCRPAEGGDPDIQMIRACGSLLHQGMGGIVGGIMKKDSTSPYRGTLIGGHKTTFNITGDMENGLHVDYAIHVAASVQVSVNDEGEAESSLALKEGSGWGAEFSFELKKQDDGTVEVTLLQPVHLDFMVDPAS